MGRGFTGYSIHKKMFPGTDKLKDEADGTSGTDIDFIDSIVATDTGYSITVINVEDGHRKVLKAITNGDNGTFAYFRHNFTARGIGTIEWWFKYTDNGIGLLSFYMDGDAIIIEINSLNNLLIYHAGDGMGGTATANIACPADTWHHIRQEFNCTTDKQKLWLNGTVLLANNNFRDDVDRATFSFLRIQFNGFGGANAAEAYWDAIGEDWDANYAIGDNVHWRNYKESDDPFEGEDVGTQGTSITWVNIVDNADDHEIVQEFNEHKKILRTYLNSGAGDCRHVFASQSKNGWLSCWVKVADADAINGIIRLEEGVDPRILVQIDNDRFEYSTGGGGLDAGVVAVADTWYHVYLQWYDDNTFDLWVDNIQYLEGVSTFADFTGLGVNRWVIDQDTAGANYIYLDAPMSSLDSDVRGDNRTFEYHTYTKTDITDYVVSAVKTSEFYKPFAFTFQAIKDFYFDEVFFQFLDVNDKLAFEGDMKNRIQSGKFRDYPCRDKCWDEYNEPLTQTFSLAKIHDPTDSASMLKVVVPTVGQVDGDLILVNADTKTDTYSPTLKNYPTELFLKDLADIADSNIIRYADGRIGLDDDLASGIVLDVDTQAQKDQMTWPPTLNNIVESFNYFEIFGMIDPNTGERYSKTIDNSGTDKKHKYRYVNNSFRNQTDVDVYAVKIAARVVTALQFTQSIQSLGGLELGTTIDYKYVSGEINIPQANYFIIKEILYLHKNRSFLTLSEGVIESSKYANYYEKALENTNAFAAEIYETDINTVYLEMYVDNGATTEGFGVRLNAVGEEMKCNVLVDDKVDPTRKMFITISWLRIDVEDDTISAVLDIDRWPRGAGVQNVEHLLPITLNACADQEMEYYTYEMSPSDVNAGNSYTIALQMDEVDRSIIIRVVAVRYYVKRLIA